MGHEGVDGAEGGVLHKVLIDEAVAIGNPLFAVVAHPDFAEVALLAPHGIGHVEPEGGCPRADGGVEEDVFLDVAAHHAFGADDALGIFFAHGAGVGPYGTELGTDAVELEEAEVIAAVFAEVDDGVGEHLVVGGVGELHASLAGPILAAVVAALPVAPDRAEPSPDAGTHLPRQTVALLEAVGEVGVERPRAVVVPTVVPDEGIDVFAVAVEELFLPLAHHLVTLGVVHVAGVVGVVVAVDVELVPRDVGRHGAPRHGTLTLIVGQEGTARLTGGDEADHGTHLPRAAGSERGVAAPGAEDGRGDGSGQMEGVAEHEVEADVAA